ncbi:MAG: DUF349 domain-containing protein [Salinivirgaceae bacterium]
MENLDYSNEQNQPEEGANLANPVEIAKVNPTPEPILEEVELGSVEIEDLTENVPEIEEHSNLEESHKIIMPEDYSIYDRATLIAKLHDLITDFTAAEIRNAVEEIKINFYKKYKAELAEATAAFLEAGGKIEDFVFADQASEETFKSLYNKYKDQKSQLNHQSEEVKQANLKAKLQIVDEIKELVNNEESINRTFQEFRDLQQKWRDIGLVPQSEVKNLWENYNHHVEKFYDYIKINKELRDLDLKKNMELKMELCEKAEALLIEDSVTKAFKLLQDYHNHWREIGPVPREQKEDIWDRFKNATSQINKKHQEYFDEIKDQQIRNLEQKIALCERIEEVLTADFSNPKVWEDKAHTIIEIQKLWRTIGFAPKKDNNKVYQRFKTGCDKFFSLKRDFYKEAKEVQKNNLQYKLDLCVQAEALKDSAEWKKTTEDFVKLQKRWKEIGPVPKKHSDILWKRFRTACDSFFNKKSEFYNTADTRQEENLKLKLELIDKVKTFVKGGEDKENLRILIEIQKQWSEIGHVPLNKKDEITKEFRDAINAQFDSLKIDVTERDKINYRSKVENWAGTQSKGKIYSERSKLATRLKEMENEIALYENNIGFFSKSKNSSALLLEVNRKIDLAKKNMEDLKQKIRLLDTMDQE